MAESAKGGQVGRFIRLWRARQFIEQLFRASGGIGRHVAFRAL